MGSERMGRARSALVAGVLGGLTLLATPAAAGASRCGEVVSGLTATVTCDDVGQIQTFTVPRGVSEVTIEADGSQGGAVIYDGSSSGGDGARLVSGFAVSAGETLGVLAGGAGETSKAYGAGGGGGSFVWKGEAPSEAATGLLIAAAGGGGGSGDTSGGAGSATEAAESGGGGGGGAAGVGGNGGAVTGEYNGGGGGGGLLSGGGTSPFGSGGYALVAGGTGGYGFDSWGGYGGGGGADIGGGGGGGYNGGGGGRASNDGLSTTGGGGGGSFSASTPGVQESGVHAGYGSVVMTYAMTCKAAVGHGHYLRLHQAGRVTLLNKLSTNLAEKQALVVSYETGVVRFRLTKLTKATCAGSPGERTFQGEGKAAKGSEGGYTLTFALSEGSGGGFLFESTLSKEGKVVEASGGPLTTNSEKIE